MKTKTEKELEREIENAQFSVPYTYKNFPFLIEMRKDDWIVNQHNKAILINAFKRGKLEKTFFNNMYFISIFVYVFLRS